MPLRNRTRFSFISIWKFAYGCEQQANLSWHWSNQLEAASRVESSTGLPIDQQHFYLSLPLEGHQSNYVSAKSCCLRSGRLKFYCLLQSAEESHWYSTSFNGWSCNSTWAGHLEGVACHAADREGGGGRIISCSHWKATSKRFIQRPWNVFIASSGFICLPAAGQIPFWRNLWRPLQKVDIRDWIHSARCYYALAAIRQSFHPIAVATDKRNVEHATAMTHFRVDDGFLSAATFFFGFGACLTDLGR